jgi:parvulin-like peptidyl-prolyl isomerase
MKVLRLMICAGLAVCWTACAAPILRNAIAAIVNDSVVTFQEVENYAQPGIELLVRTYYNQPEILEQKRIEALTKGLEDLVDIKLILNDFKDQGGMLPDSIIEDEIKDRIRQKYGDRASLTKTLQAQGITLDAYRQRTRDEIIVGYMRQKNISQAVLISPTKIEHFYATNLSQFKLGDQVKLRMIVLNAPPGADADVLTRAREILAKIDEGASFAEMAGVYHEGSQRQQQGDWGWVEYSKKNGLSELAFELAPGQHSGVIGKAQEGSESYWIYQYDKAGHLTRGRKYSGKDELVEEKKFGDNASPPVAPQEFYLMFVEEKRSARTKSLEETRDEIEKNLIASERARLQKRWTDRLRAKAFVRYF